MTTTTKHTITIHVGSDLEASAKLLLPGTPQAFVVVSTSPGVELYFDSADDADRLADAILRAKVLLLAEAKRTAEVQAAYDEAKRARASKTPDPWEYDLDGLDLGEVD